MSSSEEHVVSMRFNNKQFERNAQKSLGTIDKLKKAMNFGESAKGLKKMQEEADKFSLEKMGDQISNIEKKLGVMGVVGMSVINRLTNEAIDFGKKVTGAVTKPITASLKQIETGGLSRAKNLEHAKFQMSGLLTQFKDLDKRAKAAASIIEGPVSNAVAGTAYGLDQAAVAASSLLASQVEVSKLEGVLKGIAGAASMTGRDFSDIADIFTTVAGQGRVMTMQLRQLEASGLNAAAVLAKSLGKSEAEVRELVTQGKISFEQFSKAMSDAFGEQAQRANDTFNGALSNVKAALSRIGAEVAEPGLAAARDMLNAIRPVINQIKTELGPGIKAINDLVEAVRKRVVDLFTVVNKNGERVVNEKTFKVIRRGVNAINYAMQSLGKIIKAVVDNGRAIKAVFSTLWSYIRPIAQGFFDIFPKITLDNIINAANKVKDIAKSLKLSTTVANNFRKVFRGIFQLIKGIFSIINVVRGIFFDFLKALAPAGTALSGLVGVFGDILYNIGYYLELVATAIRYTLDYFNVFEAVGEVIGHLFSAIVNLASSIFGAIGSVITFVLNAIAKALGFAEPIIEGPLDILGMAFAALGIVINIVISAIDALAGIIQAVAGWFVSATESMDGFTGGLKEAAGDTSFLGAVLNGIKYVIAAVINGLAAAYNGIVGLFRDEGDGKGVFTRLKEALIGVWEYLKKLGSTTFPAVAEKIGGALKSLWVVIKDLTKDLTPANVAAGAFIVTMIAMSAGIARLIWHLSDMTKAFTGVAQSMSGFLKTLTAKFKPQIATKFSNVLHQLVLMIVALTGAIYVLSTIPNLEDVVKNLGYIAAGLGGLLIIMTIFAAISSKGKMAADMQAIGMAMLGASVGVLAIAGALKIMDGIDTDGIFDKAIAIGAIIGVLAVSTAMLSMVGKNSARGAISLIAFAIAVKSLVGALVDISKAGELTTIQNALPTLLGIMAGLALLSFAMGRIKLTSGLSFMLVVLALKMLLPALQDLMNQVKAMLGEGAIDNFMKFIEKYQGVLTFLVGMSVAAIACATILQKSMRGLAIGLLAMIGSIYLFIQLALMINKIPFDSISYGLAVIGGFLVFFMGLMALSKYTVGSHPMKFAASLLMMSGAIAILVGLAWIINTIGLDELKTGLLVIGGFLAIFGALMVLAKFTEKSQPVKMGVMFLMMSGAIAAMIACIYVLKDIKPEDIAKGRNCILLFMGLLAGLMFVSKYTKDANFKGMAAIFTSLAVTIGVITACIVFLSELTPQEIAKGAVVVGGAMGLLMMFVAKIQEFTNTGAKWVSGRIITLIGSIMAIMGGLLLAISELAKYDVPTLAKAGVVIVAGLLLVEGFMKKLSEVSEKVKIGGAITLIGSTIALMGGIIASLIALSDYNPLKLAASAVVLTLTVLAMGKVFESIQKAKPNMKAILTFAVASAAVLIMAASLALVNVSGSFDRTIAAMTGLLVLVLAFAAVFEEINKMQINSKAIQQFLIASTALVIFAASIALINVSGNFIRTIAAAASLATLVVIYSDIFKEIQKTQMKSKAIINFIIGATALAIFAASVALINVSGNIFRTITATLALGALVIVYSEIFKEIQKAQVKTKAIKNFVGGALAVLLLAKSVATINESGNIARTVVSTAALIVLVNQYSKIFTRIAGVKVRAGAILGFVAAAESVKLLAEGIARLAKSANWPEIAASGIAIAAVLQVMGNIFNYISSSSPNLGSIAKFFLACVAVFEVALGIALLAKSNNWANIAASSVGIGLVLAVMGEIFKMISLYRTRISSILKFEAAAMAVTEVALGIKLLAKSGNWKTIAAASAGITAVLSEMGIIFGIISAAPIPNVATTGVFLLACLSVVEIAGALTLLSAVGGDWSSIAAAAAGVSATLGVMGGVFEVISYTVPNPAAIGAFLAATISVVMIAGALSLLTSIGDWAQILAAAGALDATLVVITGVCTFLGSIGPVAVAGAGYASAIIGIFIGVAAAIVGLAAVLNKISNGKAKSIIEDAGETLNAFSKAIGKFIGGFIEGIGESVCNLIAYLGKKLGEFATNAEPFFEAIKGLDSTAIQGAKDLAKVILILSASSFINGFTAILDFLGINDYTFDKSMQRLIKFGDYVNQFAQKTKDIKDPERFKTVVKAAKQLSKLADDLEPGFFDSISNIFSAGIGDKIKEWKNKAGVGESENKKIDNLKSFFESLKDMGTIMNGIKTEHMKKFKDATEGLKYLAEATPESGGWAQAIMGEKDIRAAGQSMVSFAKSMSLLSKNMDLDEGKIDPQHMKTLKIAAEALKGISDDLPKSGFSLTGLWDGTPTEIDTFGRQCVSLANSMADITSKVANNEIDQGAVQIAIDAATAFKTLAAAMPKKADVSVLWGLVTVGENQSMSDLAEGLGEFADGLVTMSEKLKDVDTSKMTTMSPYIDAVGKVMDAAAQLGETGFKSFSNTFTNFSTAITKFNDGVKNLDQPKANAFIKVLRDLLAEFNKQFLGDDKYKGMTKLFKALTTMNDTIDKLTGDGASNLDDFGAKIESFRTYLSNLLTTFNTANQNGEIDTMIKKIKEIMEALKDPSGGKGSKNYEEFSKFAKNLMKVADSAKVLTSGDSNVGELKDSLKDLGNAYKTFVNEVKGITGKSIDKAEKKLIAIKKAVESFNGKKLSTKKLAESGEQLSKATKDITDSMNRLKKVANEKVVSIATAGNKLVKKFAESLVSGANKTIINTKGREAAQSAIDALNPDKTAGVRTNLSTSASNFVAGFTNAVTGSDNMSSMHGAGVKSAQKFLEGFNGKSGLDINSPSKKAMKSGQSTVEGFEMGLSDNMGRITDSGSEMGSEFLGSFNNYLGIHSPSIELWESAKNTVAGWLGGLKESAGKIFNSGHSFGGDFLSGLKEALSKVTKGEFNGDAIMKKIKEKLDFKNVLDTKKQTKDFNKYFKDSMKAATTGAGSSDTKNAAGAAGKKVGEWSAKEAAKAWAAWADIRGNVFGDKKQIKQMAKSLGVGVGTVKNALKAYKKEVGSIGSLTVKSLLRNHTAIKKFTKQWIASERYYAKEAKRITDNSGKGTVKSNKAALKNLGDYLYKRSSEYKKSSKAIEKYQKKIDKNTIKADNLIRKIRNSNSDKARKKYKESLEKIQADTVKLRKEQAKEWNKIGNGSMKAVKKVRSEIKKLFKDMVNLSHLSTESNAITSGFEAVSETAEDTTSTIDVLSDSMSNLTEATDEAKQAYDALNESMDTGIDLFTRFQKTGTVEADAMFENADSQLEAYEEFYNGLNALEEKGLDSYIIDKLAEEGPQSLNKIRGYLQMSSEQIDSYNKRIDQMHEYELKAYERNLRRQADAYAKYLDDIVALRTKYGETYGSVLSAVEELGFGGANIVSTLLRANGDTWKNVNDYIAQSFGTAISTGVEAASTNKDVEKNLVSSATNLYSKWLDAIESNDKKKSEFDALYNKVIELGVPESMAKYIYDQGYETGTSIFQGIIDGGDAEIERGRKLWSDHGKEAVTDYFSGIADQVSSQNEYITQNSLMKANMGTFLQAWADKQKSLGVKDVDKALAGYSDAFMILVKELEEQGLSSTEIMAQINEWMANEETGWDTLISKLDLISKRSKNNAKLTGEAIKESWYKESEDLVKYQENLVSVVDKFGNKITPALMEKIEAMSPEEIAALNELDEEDLQKMADNWFDSQAAADILADKVTQSYASGIQKGLKNAATWANSYTYDSSLSAKKMTKDDRTYELQDYIKKARAAGKTVYEALHDLNQLKINKDESLKANSKNNYKDVDALLDYLRKARKKNMTWDDIATDLSNSDMNAIVGIAQEREAILAEAITSGSRVADMVAGNLLDGLVAGWTKTAEELANNEEAQVAIQTAVGALYKAVSNPSKEAKEAATIAQANNMISINNQATTNSKQAYKTNGASLAKQTSSGYKKEYEAQEGTITNKVKDVGKNVRDGSKQSYKDYGTTLGKAMADGMADGLVDNSYKIINAARAAAQRAYEAAAKELESRSPSRKFMRLGGYASEGLAIGIANKEYLATEAAESMAESTMTGFRKAIQMIDDAINGDLELSPVITPTLDLSYLNRQANGVGHLFDARVGLQYQNEEAENQNRTSTTSQTFIQNNYSPKALSREELYRQTRNQFAMAREAVSV